MELEISPPAIEIIKELEELKLEAYQDGASVSIGYGHSNLSGGEQFELGDTIDEEKAEQLLVQDLEEIQRIVNQRLSNYDITFNQTQFDVLIRLLEQVIQQLNFGYQQELKDSSTARSWFLG